MYYIYRIYYKDKGIVYVGRTNNIDNRMRQHLTSYKTIDAEMVDRIEFAQLETEADMNLYELYYILKLQPVLNAKDIAQDHLTVELDELTFTPYVSHLYDQWVRQGIDKKRRVQEQEFRKEQIKQLYNSVTTDMEKEILEQQYYILSNQDK